MDRTVELANVGTYTLVHFVFLFISIILALGSSVFFSF
jgi:hypothetical protein